MIPDMIGPFRLLRELGSGGMGRVWLAERADGEYRQQVAIKALKRGMDSDEVLRRFRVERQILANLTHPNIVHLLEGGATSDGMPYLVMDFVDGQPLDEYCAKAKPSLNARLHIFLAICDAVSYAHQRLLVHRDIKPGNVLITADGIPKLLDFGIAKILDPSSMALTAAHTSAHTPLMTPQYSSPEQVQGELVTTSTDVYGLGLLLYELLVDAPAFETQGRSTASVLTDVLRTSPLPPSQRPTATAALRGDLDNIVMMALRKEPGRRYQSAEQMADDVRRHLNSEPVRARRSTIGYRAGRFVRRNAAPVTLSSLAICALIGGVIATTLANKTAERERDRAQARYQQVRQLANKLIFDYHDAMQYLPGSTTVRAQLMKDAASFLDQLSLESGNDKAVLTELATAYSRIGEIVGNTNGRSSLGDRANAVKYNNQAIALLQRLVRMPDAPDEAWYQLGTALTNAGQLARDTGRITDAIALLRRSAEAFEHIRAADSKQGKFRRELARTYLRLQRVSHGESVQATVLDQPMASAMLAKVDALYAELLREDPENPELPPFFEWVQREHRSYSMREGQISQALKYNAHCIQILEELLAASPLNTAYRDDLANNRLWDAENRWLPSHPQEAQRMARLAHDHLAILAESDSKNTTAQIRMINAKRVLGLALFASGERKTGLAMLQRAAEIGVQLQKEDPQSATLAGRASEALQTLADTLHSMHRDREALAAIQKALMMMRTVSAVDAENAGARVTIAELQLLAGRVQLDSDPGAARLALNESAQIWQALRERDKLRGQKADRPAQVAALLKDLPN